MANIQSFLRGVPARRFPSASILRAASLLAAGACFAADPDFESLVRQAETADGQGGSKEALALVSRAIQTDPKDPRGYLLRGRMEAAAKDHHKAIVDFSDAIERSPQSTEAYQLRGVEHFMMGHIDESIADFDRFLQRAPARAPYHWQRGISYYYAGRYEEGRKQFELHQTVNPQDVENAVWHFLCLARSAGLAKARSALIPIQGDSRVPMAEVHALFAGKGKAEDVLAAARAGEPSESRLREQLFYAHLYLGLYDEAAGNTKGAREHIARAAGEYLVDHYMGDVARVHLQLLDRKAPARPPAPAR